MSDTNILVVKNLNKSFTNSVKIADNINFCIKQGEVFTILGKSGSGKTTILRMIAGLENPTNGEIIIDNNIVFSKDTNLQPNKRKVSIVFQNYALLPHLSVKDNIIFGVKASNDELKELLRKTNLEHVEARYPHEISGGQQQRVALARALIQKPKILLLDEPLSNIDTELRVSLRNELKKMIKEFNITALFITHDKEDAFYLSDKIAIINSGSIVQIGSAKEIYEKPANLYCANFFGKINELSVEFLTSLGLSTQTSLFVRPEHIYIKDSAQNKAVVLDTIFYGSFYEIYLKTANTKLIVHSFECNYNVGEVVNFSIDFNKTHSL